VSGKHWRTLVSAALVGLLPCSARAESDVVAQAVTGVIASFGTPPLVPQAPEPASDPPPADLSLPSPPPSVANRPSTLQLTCDLCEDGRPAYRAESHARRGLVISGAIMGVGASGGTRKVRWGVARSILAAWIITLPASGAVAALAWLVLHFFGLG